MMKPIYVVDGVRTPFLKARGVPGPFAASDLAVYAGRELLARLPIEPNQIDETVVGCMMPSENEANIGRLIGLRLNCGDKTPGYTVQRNCASGMQSLDSAMKDILIGRHEMVLAGGAETMSRAPLIMREPMVRWLAGMQRAKTFGAKLRGFTRFPVKSMSPIISLICGLTDPIYGINMGQTAEIVAHEYGIDRAAMDKFALQSQQRAHQAQEDGVFDDEIVPIYDAKGRCYQSDDGVRADSSIENLAKLKPFFDRKFGAVTAGNSSQITDGAAMLLLASEEAVAKYQLPVLGKIVDVEWGALNPEVMGLGPVMASTPLLQRHNFALDDIDYWEINEAFAAQVLGCLRAWESAEFCREHFGLNDPVGTLDESKVNIHGGAIAQGHPVGATGARIVLHLLKTLKRQQAKRGIATLCIGGGQGGAVLLEVA